MGCKERECGEEGELVRGIAAVKKLRVGKGERDSGSIVACYLFFEVEVFKRSIKQKCF